MLIVVFQKFKELQILVADEWIMVRRIFQIPIGVGIRDNSVFMCYKMYIVTLIWNYPTEMQHIYVYIIHIVM
jgi:hypothetical protein